MTLKYLAQSKASNFNDPGGTPGTNALGGVQCEKECRAVSGIKIKKIEKKNGKPFRS